MTTPSRPARRPANPLFSSGPCTKRPGWSVDVLQYACLGRSHRSKAGKARLKAVLDQSRTLLGLPDDYRIAIVPASDTGAVEMALWSLLGPREVDVLAWESFGQGWVTDITKQLKLDGVRTLKAGYGALPALGDVDFTHDVVFTWNGTTSGVCVPDGDWIADDRDGLTICDATSVVFAFDLPWDKLDVTTYSWQKVLGGEAAHGMLILSPRAVARLESHQPTWPMPKVFRMTKGGKLDEALFTGATINTPSMLCVEDALDALQWVASIGGLPEMVARARRNLGVLESWVAATPWVDFLAEDAATRSPTSVCLKIVDPWFAGLDADAQAAAAKKIGAALEAEGVGLDVDAYRDAPPGLRIWCGGTVEHTDLESLTPWLDWAFETVKTSDA
ncbi:MAG: phosphoserine transaminase [Alphaproteobacteria bacterium]